ncbi:hypothetical protein BJY52DRAFT_600873 [Lactarius psammicola]|nr:hypothetical protein BJY52DRAFT_600873 [Lactarius psammicola]
MTSAAPATRNKLLKLNGYGDTISSQDYTRTTDSPESSPQSTVRCLDDTESPSSSTSEDDPSDTNADESESQGLAGCARASSSMEQVHGLEADTKNPRIMHKKSSRRTSFGSDLDLSVIIALIAPLVNWLTGSDHLKSLFLVLFLIIYLHQLVQVPWELYNASRRRRPHPSFRSLNLQENEEAVIKIETRRAETELQRHEFAYLFLSMATPFAGAVLLRSVLRSINGVDSISWFSTMLFVLAAGVRPWGHLISRLREHTSSLHDSIHYPSPDSQFIVDSRLQAVVDRVNSLEQELSTVKRVMAMRAYVDDMHEELNGALQDTERTIRKQERRAESTRNSYDSRFAMLEKAISRIERTRGERARGTALSGTSMTNRHRYKSLEFVVDPIFHFLRALANGLTFDYFDPPSTQTSPKTPPAFMGPRPSLHHAKPPNWPWLETIEEDAMEQPNTDRCDEHSSFGRSDNEAPLTSCQSDPDDVGMSRRSLRQSPRNMTNVIANVVSLPYRLAVGIIVAISPPLQHFFL